MSDTDFKQPQSHDPDLVVGDTVDEVKSPFVQPDMYVQTEHTSDFNEPTHHDSSLIVGDVISELRSQFVEPIHHDPDLVIGDDISEVSVPTVGVVAPVWEPQQVSLPVPHNPAGVIGDDPSEIPQPVGLTTPRAPFVPNDVVTPPQFVPSDSVADVVIAPHPPVVRPPPPPDAVAQSAGSTHIPASIDQILADLRERDARLERMISRLGESEFYSSIGGPADGQGSRGLDPTVTSKLVMNYVRNAGPAGVGAFVAIQTVLHSMNKKYGRIFNPLYIASVVGPVSLGKVALDTDENIHTRMTSIEDEAMRDHVLTGKGEFSKLVGDNSYGPDNPYKEGSVSPHGAFSDLALGDISDPVGVGIVQSISENVDYGNGIKRRQIDMSKMFDQRTGKLLPKFAAGSSSRKSSRENDTLAGSSFNWPGSKGVIPAAMNVEDETYGNVSDEIGDDEAYVPFMLQDLRPGPDGTMRRVYFRALNIQTGESVSPNWNEEEAFGRVDPIVGYRSTSRTLNISFAVHAFSPEDLPVIYRKRHWLSSMVYPSVARDLTLTSGPICRIRLGDLYNNARGGLPGVIKSLEFDDSEQTWEIKKGYKVPHGFSVSLSFLVLHEGTPGVLDGQFTSVRASIPQRSQGDPSRFDKIVTEVDDGLFSAVSVPRRRT